MWCCCTTDCGPIEVNARKHILALTENIPNFIFVDGNCFEHQAHLAVLGGLALTDEALKRHNRPFKYYSSLAIFSACARDLSAEIYKIWTDLFGAVQANKYCKTLIPKSNAGRWGCVDAIERRLLDPPPGHWASCLTRAILKKLNLSESELASFKGILPNDLISLFMVRARTEKSEKSSGGVWAKSTICECSPHP